jgi:hypothetical protein
MKIMFTDHAKMRCAQRNISEKWIEARLMGIPFAPKPYAHNKLLDGTNIFVAYADGSTIRRVVTVYLSTEPVDDSPPLDVTKHLSDARDKITKAVMKSRKRSKRDKSKKFKKR